MKKNYLVFCLGASVALLLTSCSDSGIFLTARKYRPGWYVSTKSTTKNAVSAVKQEAKAEKTDHAALSEAELNDKKQQLLFETVELQGEQNTTLIASANSNELTFLQEPVLTAKQESTGNTNHKWQVLNKQSLLPSESKIQALNDGIIQNTPEKNQKLSNQSKQMTDDVPIDGLGLTSFITGIVGLIILALPLGVLSIIFSAIAMGRISKKKTRGLGFAITGLILGIIDAVVGILILAAVIALS